MAEDQRSDLSGGALCLDFVNTLGDRPRAREEHLRSYHDLLDWAREADVLSSNERAHLSIQSAARHEPARQVFARAIGLRECLYRIFSKIAAGSRPEAEDLDSLNRHLSEALRHVRVSSDGDRFGWWWAGSADALDRMLWPVIRSAATLLTSEAELETVRECASETCSWLFLDHSRNHSRKWCDMSSCGNRAKARRHYRRKRAAAKKM
jgi:predicted RNA-binding Zn ribbon-like protein